MVVVGNEAVNVIYLTDDAHEYCNRNDALYGLQD